MTAPPALPDVLICAGLDPSGGAGLIADVRVVSELGARAVGVVTALTVQNTTGAIAVEPVAAALVREQLEFLLSDIELKAVKIGMLGASEVAGAIAAALALTAAPLARIGNALDGAPTDRATVAAYLELYWSWYRDALCLAAGGAATLLVHADQEPALRALAARMPAPALLAALARVKAAWVALETALLGLGGVAA